MCSSPHKRLLNYQLAFNLENFPWLERLLSAAQQSFSWLTLKGRSVSIADRQVQNSCQ
jgi:hypothetical protein